jgi:hypothetical protein
MLLERYEPVVQSTTAGILFRSAGLAEPGAHFRNFEAVSTVSCQVSDKNIENLRPETDRPNCLFGERTNAPPRCYAPITQPDRIAFALRNFVNDPICDDLVVMVSDLAEYCAPLRQRLRS